MMETLRVLFSIAFLSAVFLVAYNYINSSTGNGQGSLSSFFGDNSDKEEESEPASAEDSFQFDAHDSSANPTNQPFMDSPSVPFDNAADDVNLPLMPPASQSITPSAPYGNSVSSVNVNAAPQSQDPSLIVPMTPDVSSDSVVGPIDPETPAANDAFPAPDAFPPSSQMVSDNANLGVGSDERAAVAAFIRDAKQRMIRGEIFDTLIVLSQFYAAPQFTPDEAKEFNHLLKQLAGEVIYLHPEKYFNYHTVQAGETITSIAQKYQIPWQFIAKINGLMAPYHVNPGEQIKVVPGPFNAEIHLDKFELTLWLPIGKESNESLYAGTFYIGLGNDCPKLLGDYIIDKKFINPEYPKFSNNPTTFGPGDSNNPYGKRLLSLTCVSDPNHVKIGIHGTNDSQSIRHSVPYGFICLGELDIDNLYDILSVGSRVKIER